MLHIRRTKLPVVITQAMFR